MNNNIQIQQQDQNPAKGASSKARGGKAKGKAQGIPSGVWKEIPLSQLRRWARNVRTEAVAEESGSALEASIQSQGLLQNLVVIEAEDGFYDVAAGGRRLSKLQALAEKKKLAADTPIMCLVVPEAVALTASLTENVQRANMHPADEFTAFQELANAGIPVEDIAASFGVMPVVVTRRLKLARVSPRLIEAYRAGEATLEQMQVLTISDDHAAQEAAFFDVPNYCRHPSDLRRALTREDVQVRYDAIAKFVGVEDYERAGGTVRRDLFSSDDEAYITDMVLLDQLAAEKLAPEAEAVQAEGWKWVDVAPRGTDVSIFSRVHSKPVDPSPEHLAEKARLEADIQQLESEMEAAAEAEDYDKADECDGLIYEAREALDMLERSATRSYAPEDLARAGCVVYLLRSGDVAVHRGLVKPEDAAQVENEQGAGNEQEQAGEQEKTARLSDRMGRQLTAHKTAALQVELARNPKVALATTVHSMVMRVVHDDYYWSFKMPIGVSLTQRGGLTELADDLKNGPALQAMAELIQHWRERLPAEPKELFAALLELSLEDLAALFAVCVGTGVDVVSDKGTKGDSAADELARTLGLDMRNWWQPTAESYFSQVPKGLSLEAMQVVAADEVVRLSALKKGDLASESGRLAEGSGWLPAILSSHEPQA
ncbi:Chromosome-partitioning protein Spo0J [compost metagenome]